MPANSPHAESSAEADKQLGRNDLHPFDRAMRQYMQECTDLAAKACRDEHSVTLDTPISEERLQEFLGHVRTVFNKRNPQE